MFAYFMYKFTGFTEKANRALNCAVETAENLGHTYVGSEHLLLAMLRCSGWPAQVLRGCGADPELVQKLVIYSKNNLLKKLKIINISKILNIPQKEQLKILGMQ